MHTQPSGAILLWPHKIDDIPSGYVLCDGNNGSPDLRNTAIPNAGDTHAVDVTNIKNGLPPYIAPTWIMKT